MIGLFLIVAFVVGMPALLLGVLRLVSPEHFRNYWPERWPLQLKIWHVCVAVGLAALVFMALNAGPHESGFFTFIICMLILAGFLGAWRHEVLFLMSLKDDELPGRHDKILWAILLFALAPVGVWFFRSYRLTHWPEPEPARAKPSPTPEVT
jgi:hypothetical protein